MDYGKFKFDEAQRAKESRRKASNVSIKEMKYRPKIGPGDFETKTRQVGRFLGEGHKVKVTIMFRGREVFHPELGKRILDRVAEEVDGTGKVEIAPRLDGRNMVMVLAPDRRAAQQAAARAHHSTDHVDGEEHVDTEDHLDSDDHESSNYSSPAVTAPTEVAAQDAGNTEEQGVTDAQDAD
jgi:translation initiation factor IF-3